MALQASVGFFLAVVMVVNSVETSHDHFDDTSILLQVAKKVEHHHSEKEGDEKEEVKHSEGNEWPPPPGWHDGIPDGSPPNLDHMRRRHPRRRRTKPGDCFHGEATVLKANGELVLAKDVQVGDVLATQGGGRATVQAHIIQSEGPKEVVRIGDLLISQPHRIFPAGKWIKPIQAIGAEVVNTTVELHNFIVDDRKTLIVDGMIVSTIGTYCEGAHDLSRAKHRLWASDKIVSLFKRHPGWPNIRVDNYGDCITTWKTAQFAKWFLAQERPFENMPEMFGGTECVGAEPPMAGAVV